MIKVINRNKLFAIKVINVIRKSHPTSSASQIGRESRNCVQEYGKR